MTGLADSERISMIRSAVLIQSTRVTDGTDRRSNGIGVAYTCYSMLSRVKTIEYGNTDKLSNLYKRALGLYIRKFQSIGTSLTTVYV